MTVIRLHEVVFHRSARLCGHKLHRMHNIPLAFKNQTRHFIESSSSSDGRHRFVRQQEQDQNDTLITATHCMKTSDVSS